MGHSPELARLFDRLHKAPGGEQAEVRAQAIRTFREDRNAPTRASFEEAGGRPARGCSTRKCQGSLHRTPLSTNCIENAFRNLRRHLG